MNLLPISLASAAPCATGPVRATACPVPVAATSFAEGFLTLPMMADPPPEGGMTPPVLLVLPGADQIALPRPGGAEGAEVEAAVLLQSRKDEAQGSLSAPGPTPAVPAIAKVPPAMAQEAAEEAVEEADPVAPPTDPDRGTCPTAPVAPLPDAPPVAPPDGMTSETAETEDTDAARETQADPPTPPPPCPDLPDLALPLVAVQPPSGVDRRSDAAPPGVGQRPDARPAALQPAGGTGAPARTGRAPEAAQEQTRPAVAITTPAPQDNPLPSAAMTGASSGPVPTDTPATPVPPAQPIMLQRPDWPQTVVSLTLATLGNDGGTMVLELAPGDLGQLRVTLMIEGDQAVVRIQTDTPDAAQALNDSEPQLAQDFARQGVVLASHDAQADRRGSWGPNGWGRNGWGAPTQDPGPTHSPDQTVALHSHGLVNLIA